MTLRSVALLVLFIAVASASHCAVQTGDVYSGIYSSSTTDSLGGFSARFAIGDIREDAEEPAHAVVEGTETDDATFFSFWRLETDSDGGTASIFAQDVASIPSTITCGPDIIANYALNWNDECNQFSLSVIADSCQGRLDLWDGMILSVLRGPDPDECSPFVGLDVSGRYAKAKNNTLSKKPNRFVFGVRGYGSEVNPEATYFIRWVQNPDVNEVTVQDILSRPESYACPSDIQATYRIDYKNDCGFSISEISPDGCSERAVLYDDMKTKRNFDGVSSAASKLVSSVSIVLMGAYLLLA